MTAFPGIGFLAGVLAIRKVNAAWAEGAAEQLEGVVNSTPG